MNYELLVTIFYFIIGTAVGSFLNVWSRRLLKGQPPTGRSHCESCDHVLAAVDLIPLVSFLLLRGRCRYCHKPLSRQYPLVEFATGLVFAAISLVTNYELLTTVPLLIASSALIVIFITDFKKQVIFDQTTWVAFSGALLYRLLFRLPNSDFGLLAADLLGSFAAFLFFVFIRLATKKRGLGEGDPPLGFVAALLVGFPSVLVELFLAFVIGGLTGVALVLSGKRELKDRIAFGPFLVTATFLTIFFGNRLLDWYLGFLGL
jgi:leader peptidase (prepilin peptidase)/N-methyltransferase